MMDVDEVLTEVSVDITEVDSAGCAVVAVPPNTRFAGLRVSLVAKDLGGDRCTFDHRLIRPGLVPGRHVIVVRRFWPTPPGMLPGA